jgi:hypothetical protein
MNQVGNAVTPGAANIASTAPVATNGGNALGGIGSLLSNDTVKGVGMDLAKEGIGTGMDNMQQNAQNTANSRMAQSYAQASAQQQKEKDDAFKTQLARTQGGISGGRGMGMNKGGEVALQEGQFIIPADVVSALGDGSTKAGANFLDEFFGV